MKNILILTAGYGEGHNSAARGIRDGLRRIAPDDVHVELHDLLSETLGIPEAKAWLLDRKIVANEVGLGLLDYTRAFLESLTPRALAEFLIGGLATSDLPDDFRSGYVSLAREATGVREYLMPPLPNTLYTRDTSCWLYGGVTLNPLYWPARHDETLLMKAVYEFHPDFAGSTVWWGDPELDWGMSTFEGASSRTRIRGSAMSARAKAISWRWPAESCEPRSPK